MGSHEPRPVQSQSYRRSRSPLRPRLGTAAEHTEARARWRSPGGVQEFANEREANKEKRKAEDERRGNILERLEEKGQELLHELEVNDRMVVLLQETPKDHRGRVRCRAEDCVYAQVENPDGRCITDNYRICVDKGRSYDGKHYYHVLCMECMIDLRALIPSKFKMAGAPSLWGIMVQKWFEHRGSITLDKIATFLEERDAYNKESCEFSKEFITWSLNHKECQVELGICSCPPPPKSPDTPVLKDYIAREEEGCDLSDVLEHPRVEDQSEEFITSRSFIEGGRKGADTNTVSG